MVITRRGAHMISRAALTDIDEEILREYRETTSALHEHSLPQYDYIEGGTRHAPCPTLDDLDADGPVPSPLSVRRKYAERI